MRFRINHDYFSLNTPFQKALAFIRQGHVIAHLLDRIKWHYYPRFFLVPSFPTHLDIEASSACQLRCPMCKTTNMIECGVLKPAHMSFELFQKIIDECVANPLYSIKLSWRGEPLLNPNIIEMVEYAKRRGIHDVAFLTNGDRLTPDLSSNLVKAGLDWISISFDGLEEAYNRIRKPANFKRTFNNVKELRKIRDQKGTRKPLIRIQSIHSAIRGNESEFFRLWEGVADKVNLIADQIRSLNESDYKHDPTYLCPSPWQRMCIASDGSVAQCYSDYLVSNVLGDVKNEKIKDIWLGPKFQALRLLMKKGRRLETKACRTCSDGGILAREEIIVEGRRLKVAHYTEQGLDIKKIIDQENESSDRNKI